MKWFQKSAWPQQVFLLWLHAVLLIFFLFGAVFHVAAALPSKQPFVSRIWRTEDGLPVNSVSAVRQSRDGYLWVGTYGGLARFDGIHFTVFDEFNTPELRDSRVTSLFEDTDGALWVGHETGELTCYRQGRFEAVVVPTALKNTTIEAIESDELGIVWVATTDGRLMRLKDGLILNPANGDLPANVILTKGERGRIWICKGGRVSMLNEGKLTPIDFDGSASSTHVQIIAQSHRGGIWVVSEGRIRRWENNGWAEDAGSAPWKINEPAALLETQTGDLIAATSNEGVYIIHSGKEIIHLNRANGFPSDWLRRLWEDHEGNYWVASANGLIMIRTSEVTTMNPPDQWQGRAVLSVCEGSQGALWVGTEGAGLYQLDSSVWRQYGITEGISNLYVWSVCRDLSENILVGTWGDGILAKEAGRFRPTQKTQAIEAPVFALLPSLYGGIWVGTSTGLLCLKDGQMNVWGENIGLVLPHVCAIVEEKPGRIWFGMAGGGLGCLENGKVRQFREPDGLLNDFVWCLHLDQDGTLWIGTSGGLIRFKNGHFAAITMKQGLPNNVICQIEDDGQGCFWLGSHGGIIRVSKKDLDRCADGRNSSFLCQVYGRADGLPTTECSSGSQPSSCRTTDGRLWFATSRGLVVVDPQRVKQNALVPPVVIEELRMDGHYLGSGDADGWWMMDDGGKQSSVGVPPRPPSFQPLNSSIMIAAGHHRLEFFYTGLSLMAPEKVRFKYRLAGFDKSWIDAGSERRALYSYIPPGHYSFKVIACNNDGVWNETGAGLALTIQPYFWQTAWFSVTVCCAIMTLVGWCAWFLTRRRMRARLEKAERQQAVEHERARIARDIHDRLGSGLSRIMFLGQMVRKNITVPEKAGPDVDRLDSTARELTREMDEIVWAVNPQHDTLDSLATYLGNHAQEFLRGTNIRCRLDFPLELPPWPVTADVRHNLFLALKETLHNTFKHSKATQVSLSLQLKKDGFTLEIVDDGCGFKLSEGLSRTSPTPERLSSGNGLKNIHRRLSELGGQLNVCSEPGTGTRVIFVVPIRGIHA